MKKYGFSLAEMLVTLGLIGVIASLTMPSVVNAQKNKTNASKLAVCVSSIENALSTAVAQENVDNLTQTRMWTSINGNSVYGNSSQAVRDTFADELGKYLISNGTTTSNSDLVTNYYGNNNGLYPMNNDGGSYKTNGAQGMDIPGTGSIFPILLKNGAVAWFRVYKEGVSMGNKNDIIAAGSDFYMNPADVHIDVNGKNGPNTYGRDVFAFLIGDRGKLYPVGGFDVGLGANRWDNPDGSFPCTDNKKYSNDRGVGGWGCAGRVVEEGFKINY